MAAFGELLAELRQDKKMTQAQLAEVLHVSTGTISNYEKSVHYPDLDKLISLADFFHVTTDYFLGRCSNNISPDAFEECVTPTKTIGELVQDIQRLSPERKQTLVVILEDMVLSSMLKEYQKRGIL